MTFAVKLMAAWRSTGSLAAKPEGGWRYSKLDPHRDFLIGRVAEQGDITMPEFAAELSGLGTVVAPSSISRWLIRNGYRLKKRCWPASRPGRTWRPHASPKAEAAIKARGAWMLFLPPYSPDLNPTEMAFAKLKANLRARAIRTMDGLWQAIGDICDLYSATECKNYFKAAGYA